MRRRNTEHQPSREVQLVEAIFHEAAALAKTYEYPHYIWRAMDSLGVREIQERRRLFPIVKDRIDSHDERDIGQGVHSDSWRPNDIFSEEGTEWLIQEAHKHLLEYPDPEEFVRDWEL